MYREELDRPEVSAWALQPGIEKWGGNRGGGGGNGGGGGGIRSCLRSSLSNAV